MKRIFVLLASGMLLAACTERDSGVGARLPMGEQGVPEYQPTTKVQALDRATWESLRLQKLIAIRTSDGRPQIVLDLANLSDVNLVFSGRAVFYDDIGREMDKAEWQTFTITRRNTAQAKFESLRRDVANYRIELADATRAGTGGPYTVRRGAGAEVIDVFKASGGDNPQGR